jgi:demethylmenaquinone methyltransferase/2-methoxy-6-polyprenyl-1,4-benzoquinol methylase
MTKKEVKSIKRSKAEARKFYDKISSIYDLFIGKFEKKNRRKGLELLNVNKGDKVLEIGFGTGESILLLAEKVGKTGEVYGVDISQKMYQLTVEKVKNAG